MQKYSHGELSCKICDCVHNKECKCKLRSDKTVVDDINNMMACSNAEGTREESRVYGANVIDSEILEIGMDT